MVMPSASSCRRRLTLALLLLLLAPWALAQRQAPEAELKAAIFLNMLLFVDWPSPAGQRPERLTVCYLEPSPVSAALEQFGDKLLKGKPLQVKRLELGSLGTCQALYLSPSDAPAWSDLVTKWQTSGVLLMGDSPGYLQRGVMLNLALDQGRVVFDVDLRAARVAGLTLSSKMLRLARQVQE